MIDYKKVDFTQEYTQYDVIFDIVGSSPHGASLQMLMHNGCFVFPNVGLWPILRTAITRRVTDKRVITKPARITEANLQTLCKQIGEKSIETSIDSGYKLEEVVEAHRYTDTGDIKAHVAYVFGTAAEPQTKDQ